MTVETYSGGKESVHSIKKIRTLLRSKAISLLNTETEKTSIDFLLELLLVITTDKDLKVRLLNNENMTICEMINE